ncbi:hypothetical protein TRFO_26600 [Tritrichomonas foetus]|uniref:Beige/BEACH domain containing protein n=1 Tax=Tritrichomonas foetus TaxID=1144522 RepID=A0A1J4K7A8_9EUKA|nr:hypothetical protein TRFO_26600 [Tritrichomonas foetus]|eukprot:OHT05596.1 hypothetical protein TRFO_26600 [Tritrichomonas foetus]
MIISFSDKKMNLSFLEHHGGDSSHLVWIKYYSMPCKITIPDKTHQTPLEFFLQSFEYNPIPIRQIKKAVESSNLKTIDKKLASIFKIDSIPITNYLLFSQMIIEQMVTVKNSPNISIVPQFMMRGFIALNYQLPNIKEKYEKNEEISGFQPEMWKFIHYPLTYLLNSQPDICEDTFKIIHNYFRVFSSLEFLIKLQPNNLLRAAFFTNLTIFIKYFILEFNLLETSTILDFLFSTFTKLANMIYQIPNSVEVMNKCLEFFQDSIPLSQIFTQKQCSLFLDIYIAIISQIKTIIQNEKGNVTIYNYISFIKIGLTLFEKVSSKFDDKCAKHLTQSLCLFFNYLFDTIPFERICTLPQKSLKFKQMNQNSHSTSIENKNQPNNSSNTQQIDEKINEFSDKSQTEEGNCGKSNQNEEEWTFYLNEKDVLQQIMGQSINSPDGLTIMTLLQKFMKASDHICSTILETFRCCVDFLDEKRKIQLSLSFFLSVLEVPISLNNISEDFILMSLLPSSFPSANFLWQMNDLDWYYHDILLQFMFNFSIQSTEKLNMILKVIQIFTSGNNFLKIIHFLPFFRSLIEIDSKINFIHHFFESKSIESFQFAIINTENEQLKKQMASLFQTMAYLRPLEVFKSPVFLQAIHNLLLLESLQEILTPCFKVGMSLCHSQPHELGILCSISTLKQVLAILNQATTDKTIHNIAQTMIIYLTESVGTFDESVFDVLSKEGLFETISRLPLIVKTSEFFLLTIKFFGTFSSKFTDYFVSYNQLSNIFHELEIASKNITLTQSIVDCLIYLMLNSHSLISSLSNDNVSFLEKISMDSEISMTSEIVIQNRLALSMILHIVQDTEFEGYFLNLIFKLCKNSLDNTYECFLCDVIGFTLQRIIKNKHNEICYKIFKWIGQRFFSNLNLNQVFKAMRLGKDGKKHPHHFFILNNFLDMIIEEIPIPVSSYFHFSRKNDGIIIKNIDPSILTYPFSFSTTFKILNSQFEQNELVNEEVIFPILELKEKENFKLSVFIKNQRLFIYHQDQKSSISDKFLFNKWYLFVIIFTQTNIQVSINDQLFQPNQIIKHEFHNCINLYFAGNKAGEFFNGFFGQTVFMKHDSIQETIKSYQKLNKNRCSHFSNILINISPFLAKRSLITDVIKSGDSYSFKGYAAPSISTISKVLQTNGVFQNFLPLFILLNHPFKNSNQPNNLNYDQDSHQSGNKNDENSNDTNALQYNDHAFFYVILTILQRILGFSVSNQKLFKRLGGFQLLAGFFGQIKAQLFTKNVLAMFSLIYKTIKVPSLQSQMIEFIWLNFDLWSSMSSEFQINLYKDFLRHVCTPSQAIRAADIKSLDFMLYLIQCPFPDKTRLDPYLIMFPNVSLDENQIDTTNVPCFLDEKEKHTIRELQWKFFSECVFEMPSVSTLLGVSMIATFHPIIHLRLNAFKIIEDFINSGSQILTVLMELTGGYENFLQLALETNTEIQYHAAYCIFLLGRQEIVGNYKHKSLTFSSAVMALILHLVRPQEIADKLFDMALQFAFESKDDLEKADNIRFPEIFPFLLWISIFVENKGKIKMFSKKLKVCLTTNPYLESFTSFFTDNKSWPLWIFWFAINLYDRENEIENIAKFIACSMFPVIKKNAQHIFALFTFLESLTDFSSIVFTNLILETVKHICKEMVDCHISSVKIVSAIFRTFLFGLKRDFATENSLSNLTNEKMNEFILFLTKQQAKLIDPSHLSVEYRFKQRQNDKFKVEFLDLSVNLLSLIAETLLILPDSQFPLFNEFVISLSQCFCYIFDFINSSGNEKLILLAQKQLAKIPAGCSLNHSLYQDLEDKVIKGETEYQDIFLSVFMSEISQIISSLQNMTFVLSAKNHSHYRESFNEFIKAHSKTRLIVSLHNHKLGASFFREITSNNFGPWARETSCAEIKWMKTSRIDSTGRILFMKINKNFDDHKKASALRDSREINSSDKDSSMNNYDMNDHSMNFKNILKQKEFSFIPAPIEQVRANATFHVTQITRSKRINGTMYLSDARLIFDGYDFADSFGCSLPEIPSDNHKYLDIIYSSISFIFWRKILHADLGIEIFVSTNKSFLFSFTTSEKRHEFLEIVKKFTDKLNSYVTKPFELLKLGMGTNVQTIPSIEIIKKCKITEKWQNHKISNFTYLFYLNTLSGRSYNDISQYPVYPWVISDYTSDTIDLNNKNVYRDLSKPIGALNRKGMNHLKKRLLEYPDHTNECLFRTHYLAPAYVIGYLIRTEPFSTLHIQLQDGCYDIPERLFYSIPETWSSLTREDSSDYRELIPEFYFSPRFLRNENNFDLGTLMATNTKINDVELPKWAKNPYEFIEINRRALESDYVSQNLHKWIGLIFGINQRNFEYENVFHPYTYSDCINSKEVKEDPNLLAVMQSYAANFGVCPSCIFNEEHPERFISSLTAVSISNMSNMPNFNTETILMMKNGFILTSKFNLYNLNVNSSRNKCVTCKSLSQINSDLYKNNVVDFNDQGILVSIRDGTALSFFSFKTGEELGTLSHDNNAITCVHCLENKAIITGGNDCVVYIWNAMNLKLIGSILSHTLPIVKVYGDLLLDVVVIIDEEINAYIYSLRGRRFMATFKVPYGNSSSSINSNNDSKYIIRTLSSGYIVISCSVFVTSHKSKSFIFIYDLCGALIHQIEIEEHIKEMITISTSQMYNYIIVSTSMKEILIYDSLNFQLVKKINDQIFPKFLSSIGNSKSIISVKMQQKQMDLVQFDF